jgi:large repetitive protein
MNTLSDASTRCACFANLFASFPARSASALLAVGSFVLFLLGTIIAPAQAQEVAFTGTQTAVPARGLHCPRGVAVDGTGDVFIADSNDSRIIEVPAGGGAEFTVGTGLNGPNGVTVDGTGDVFIGDSRNNRVVEVPADGGAQFTVGGGLKYPGGIAVDKLGNVFIADTKNRRVVEVPADGGVQVTLDGGLRYPLDVKLNAVGDIFIADTGGNEVVEIPAGGAPIVVPASGLSGPSGVALDGAGDLFIADSNNKRVVEIPAGGGAQTTVCGPGVAACSGLVYPYGVAVDGAGDLFIVDHAGTVGTCPEPGAVSRTLELQRRAVNFGSVKLQSSSTLTLNYNVVATTTFGPIEVVSQGDFKVGGGSTCTGTLTAPSACVVNITFVPLVRQTRSGEVELTDSRGEVLVATEVQGDGVAATTTTLTSSANPSTYGEAVTFTAAVSSSDGTIPDGETVMFMDGATVLGRASLASGSATFEISTLKVGETSITAAYDGDTNFSAGTSNVVRQAVKKAN